MLRRVVYWVCARCLRWFYRDLRVVGGDRVPATGPVLLVGNHPNDIPDVIAGLYTTPRPVRYIATVSMVTSWPARKTYEAMGVIPVARIRDARKMKAEGVDMVAVNQAAYDAVGRAFAAGDVVAVFPEGGVHDVPEIGRLRTGVAKMVLEHLDTDAKNDVTIVPFGIQYEAPRTRGSDILVQLGSPWSARAFVQGAPPEEGGLAGLTARLRDALRAVTRNAPTWEVAALRDELIAAVAAAVAPHDPLGAVPSLVPTAAAKAPVLAEGGGDAAAIRLRSAVHQLALAVERAGGVRSSAVDHARLLYALDVEPLRTAAQAPVPAIVLVAGLPAAAIGWAVHGPIFALVRAVARRGITVRTDEVARRFVPGLYLVGLWYLLLTLTGMVALALNGVSPLWILPATLTVTRFGDLAVRWRAWFEHWQMVTRVRRWAASDREVLREAAAVVRETAAALD